MVKYKYKFFHPMLPYCISSTEFCDKDISSLRMKTFLGEFAIFVLEFIHFKNIRL